MPLGTFLFFFLVLFLFLFALTFRLLHSGLLPTAGAYDGFPLVNLGFLTWLSCSFG